jgi:drug/metabolite transporter (DMT)-like permease
MSTASPAAARDPAAGVGPILAYLALCFIWGSTYLAIRMAVETLPPHIMVGARSMLAGLAMAGFAFARGTPMPDRRALLAAAVTGVLLFAGGQALLAAAEMRLASGTAAVLNATQALIMPLAVWAIGAGRAPAGGTWLGLIAGLLGVAILVGSARSGPGSGGIDAIGVLAVIASVLCWSFGSAASRRNPIPNVALAAGLQMLIGGAACMLLTLPFGEWHGFALANVSHRSWLGFAYLTTVGSFVGFGAFAWLVQIWPMERLATYTYVNPIVALLLGAALNGEAVPVQEILATALIFGAVGIVMWSGRRGR